jgi:hypothetical protein
MFPVEVAPHPMKSSKIVPHELVNDEPFPSLGLIFWFPRYIHAIVKMP